MKVYEGRRWPRACVVTVNDGTLQWSLDPRLDLFRHSPDGFEWGYAGSGPAQLALAVLSDHLGRGEAQDERAVRLHQDYKADIISHLPRTYWCITADDVSAWLARKLDDPNE